MGTWVPFNRSQGKNSYFVPQNSLKLFVMLHAIIYVLTIISFCASQGFDELLDLATQGDFRHVDMLVKDIYGDRESEYTSLGLSPTIIASSFGKAINYDARCATIVIKMKINVALFF